MSATPDLKVICWESAMSQVCDDVDFLNEVLADLIVEIQTAQNDIENAIANGDFETTMRAAHSVKGSTSYLRCEILRDLSFKLQLLGKNGLLIMSNSQLSGSPSTQVIQFPDSIEENWDKIREYFESFKTAFIDLKHEIETHSAN